MSSLSVLVLFPVIGLDLAQGSASLDMNTPGCETDLADATCAGLEERTLRARGQLILTNSGDRPATLASIAVILEKAREAEEPPSGYPTPRRQVPPADPDAMEWEVVLTAVENRYANCDGVAKTDYGDISATPGAGLFLYRDGQPISLSEEIVIYPLQRPYVDNDGGRCEDTAKVVIDVEYQFDITTLGIEGPGDGVVPSGDDLRVDMIVTFGSIGSRRIGSNRLDLNCDDDFDDPGESYARSARKRSAFDRVACTEWIDLPEVVEDQNSRIRVVESTGTHLRLDVSLPGMYVHPPVEMRDGNTYTPISAPGSGLFERGKPSLPVLGEWILVPNGTDVQLEIDPGEPFVFEDLRVPPVQRLAGDHEGNLNLPFSRIEQVYGADAYSPGIFAELEPLKRMRGQACTIIWLYPYQFNPVRNRLLVYPDLSVTVLFNGEPDPIPLGLKSESFDAMMRRTAINSDAVIQAEDDNQGPDETPYDKGPPTFGPYGWDYIIITVPKFEQAADTLAAWRRKTGFKPLVHLIPGNWQAQDIQKTLEGAYKNWSVKPQYVFIIGDAEFVPCQYKTWHPHNFSSPTFRYTCYGTTQEPYNTQGYIGTDYYFTDMEPDLVPELAIGRISVDTLGEALKRVDDIIEYEKNPVTDHAFYNNVVISGEFEDTNIEEEGKCKPDTYEDKRYIMSSEDMARFLELPQYNVNKSVDRVYYAEPNLNPGFWSKDPDNFSGGPAGSAGGKIPSYLWKNNQAAWTDWNGDGFDLVNALDQGRFLLSYRGHGARDHWRSPKLDDASLNFLNNGNKLPVILSFSCQTGWFDNETDFNGKTPGGGAMTDHTGDYVLHFSEKWERRLSGGAVGIIAGTRVTFNWLNDRLAWGILDAIWPNFLPKHSSTASTSAGKSILRMGDVLNYGRLYMMKATKAGSDPEKLREANYEAYHWFGDPAMKIRTRAPNKIVVADLPSEWPLLNKGIFSVDVDWEDLYGASSGSGGENTGALRDATVTISKAGSPEHWVGKTDEAGNLSILDFETITPGTFDIVVTAPNSIPFQGTFTSQPGPSGGILLDSRVYSCESTVEIQVADSDAGSGGIVDIVDVDNGDVIVSLPVISVQVSTSGGDEESVTLWETPDGTGLFAGTVATAVGPVQGDDLLLQVEDGETIRAEYFEAGDLLVPPAEITAVADCQPPDFDGLKSAVAENGRVVLEWDPATDIHRPITYDIYRSQTPGLEYVERIGTTWALFYPDYGCESGTTCYYLVRARDAVGNEDGNTVQKSVVVTESAP